MKTIVTVLLSVAITLSLCGAVFMNKIEENENARNTYINEMFVSEFLQLVHIRNEMGNEKTSDDLRLSIDIMIDGITLRMELQNTISQLNDLYMKNLIRSSVYLKSSWLEFPPIKVTSGAIDFVEHLCLMHKDCPPGVVESIRPDFGNPLMH